MIDDQIERVLDAVREILGDDLVGAYLFGSAVLGGLRHSSDLDVLVVSRRGTTPPDRQRLIARLLEISRRPRPVEVTIVVEGAIQPWRYPPAMDFQYGDWWRGEFDRGDLEPWSSENPDLASVIRMVMLADTPLLGPRPGEVFDPVPRRDYVAALVHGAGEVVEDLDWDTRNVVLTLARIWSSIETDEIRSKDAAADWALPRLPAELRPVLARARAIYLGEEDDRWDDLRPQVEAYVKHTSGEICRIARSLTGDGPTGPHAVVEVDAEKGDHFVSEGDHNHARRR